MPFYTDKSTLHVPGPGKPDARTGLKPHMELSKGYRFSFRPLERDVMAAKIHYRGDYDIAEKHWTCPRPQFRIWIEGWTEATWAWFLKKYFNQAGEKSIFYQESGEDVYMTNPNFGKDQEKWQLPLSVLSVLKEKGLLKNPAFLKMLEVRIKDETNGEGIKKSDVIEANNVVTEISNDNGEIDLSEEKVQQLLASQDPQGTLNQ